MSTETPATSVAPAPTASETQSTSPTESKATDTAPESKGEATPPSEAKAEKPNEAEVKAIVKELKKYKIKIDKEESEIELDDDGVRTHIQKGLAADKKFKEAAAARKEAESFLELLRTNPKALLRHPQLALDARKIAEELLSEELEQELMDPKDKEIKKLQAELEARQAKEKASLEEARQADEAKKVKAYEDTYVADIRATVEKSGLPMNEGVVNKVRDYMLAAMESAMAENDGDPEAQDAAISKIKAADVIEYVRRDFQAEVKKLFSSTDLTQLIEMIGEDGIKKLRDVDLKRLKDPKVAVKSEDQAPEKKDRAKSVKTKSATEFFDELKKKYENS